ncbi:MAG: plasmid stabilization protein, partial [Halobacteria archaeon]|nr:plasmid stabilization protein [Halobacteria archaeon]
MDHDRRRFLRFAGVATAGGVAGCLGGSESGEGNETSSDSGNMGDGTSSNSGSQKVSYGWSDATWDSYWYSLYNMSTNISLSGNGVLFPHNEKQRKVFQKRKKAILKNSDVSKPPVRNPNLNMAPFTTGDPHFTQKPDFGGKNGRPDASTLEWDKSKSSGVVSPASVAWTHLKGVTWAKNFQEHFDLLPQDVAPKFRSQVLATLAQLGVK